MHTQSILYTALWLFGATFIAVVIMFVIVIFWIVRRGRKAED
jgi:preprotein translocase subunit YajC